VIAGQILARCLLGIGADLSWRVQMTLGRGRAVKGGVVMSDLVKRNWWIPAAMAMIAFGSSVVLIHIVGDGFESEWERTATGWDPSVVERAGTVGMLALLFVALPIWALVVRRAHPAWTLVMLAPSILFYMVPLMWGDAGAYLGLPLISILALVSAVVNLAQASVTEPARRSAAA
jgi:uncharacterized membrane protein YhaH (DUF805 family)